VEKRGGALEGKKSQQAENKKVPKGAPPERSVRNIPKEKLIMKKESQKGGGKKRGEQIAKKSSKHVTSPSKEYLNGSDRLENGWKKGWVNGKESTELGESHGAAASSGNF